MLSAEPEVKKDIDLFPSIPTSAFKLGSNNLSFYDNSNLFVKRDIEGN
jgi:hypothetical protein